MKKYILINAIFMSLLIVLSSSCKKDEPIGGTSVENLSGDWFVKGAVEDEYSIVYTYNTADNTNTQMWVEVKKYQTPIIGSPNIVKGKVDVNITDQTFSGTNVANVASTSATTPTFSVANGKITSNGTTGPGSKTPADLITFDLVIGGVTYKIEGFHKTGFKSDDPEDAAFLK